MLKAPASTAPANMANRREIWLGKLFLFYLQYQKSNFFGFFL